MEKLLLTDPELPTALFCVSDIIALGSLKALKSRGLSVPEDISLVGFDDLPTSAMSDPPLTSVKVSKTQIGRRAFQLLLGRMNSAEGPSYEKVYMGCEIVVRESLGVLSSAE
jgi:LacI family transcriptional regulator